MSDTSAIDPAPDPRATAAWARHAEITEDLFCQQCGYNLRGLASDRCPECGHRLDAVRASEPRIPWIYRRQLGRLNAYWKTVWMVMFQHKRFCEEVARPVSFADAQAFRWTTVLHVQVPALVATVVAYARGWPGPFNDPLLDAGFVAVWPAVVLHVCLFLFLAAATGVPSYLFHPRGLAVEQQNRAVAMSYYAASALAWTPFSLLIGLVGFTVAPHMRVLGETLIALGLLLPPAQVVAWWADLIHIAARVMPRGKRYAVRVAVYVPVLWAGLAGLFLLALPLAVLYVLIVLASLR